MKVGEEFDFEGVTYIVKPESPLSPCLGCAGRYNDDLCNRLPDCIHSNIIFVTKNEDRAVRESKIRFLKQLIKFEEHNLKIHKQELKKLEDDNVNIG